MNYWMNYCMNSCSSFEYRHIDSLICHNDNWMSYYNCTNYSSKYTGSGKSFCHIDSYPVLQL